MDLTIWNSIKDSGNPSIIQAYIDLFPKGTFAALAKIKLGKLKKTSGTVNAIRASERRLGAFTIRLL